METVLKNRDFEFQPTLNYKDTLTAINLNDVTEIVILVRHAKSKVTLVEKKLSTVGVVIITAASGICSIYVNKADTASATGGLYEYIATVTVTNSAFTGSDAEFANPVDNAFILEE